MLVCNREFERAREKKDASNAAMIATLYGAANLLSERLGYQTKGALFAFGQQ